MKKVLIIVGGGGFSFQSFSLLTKMQKDFDCEIAIPADSQDLRSKLSKQYPSIKNIYSLPPITTLSNEKKIFSLIYALLAGFKESLCLLKKTKPNAVIVIASSMAIPAFLAAKLCKVKTIYISSITRINEQALTGKIILYLRLADRFYVQWPEMLKTNEKTVYQGTVL